MPTQEDEPTHTTTIAEYFAGKNIFITGGTGFLGKVLIEKILRCCPDVGKIYMLIRPKKGKDLQERIDQMLTDKLYDILKQSDPSQLSKLIPISGDCSQLKLGLSESDYHLITSSVSIIYHGAASVRFDDHIQDAILLNTRGTREMANLALNSKNLSIFVHVSTAYCNSIVGREVKEQFYPPPVDWRNAIKVAEGFNKQQMALLQDKYLGPYPNTYTFTKMLGEYVVKDLCEGKITTAICRPTMVINAIRDPLPGWIDNINGPIGIWTAAAKGLIRMSYQNKNLYADYIPVDSLIRSIVVATWNFGLKQQQSFEVVQCCSGAHKWWTAGEIIRMGREISAEYPFNDIMWVPKGSMTLCKFYNYFCITFFHLLPCFLLDLVLKVKGKKAFLVRIQQKIFNAYYQVRYFANQEWDFCNKKFLELETKILQVDKDNWNYDYSSEDSYTYVTNAIRGAKLYLFNDSDESLPAARRKYWRMYWLDKATMTLLYGSLAWFTIHYGLIETCFEKIWNYIYYYFDGIDV